MALGPAASDELREARPARWRGLRAGHQPSVRLWLALAQAALSADATPDEPRTAAPGPDRGRDCAADAHSGIRSGDRRLHAQALRRARSGQSREEAEIRRRVSALVTALEPDTLQRLLLSTGSAVRRRELLLTASQGLALDAVLALVEAAARTDGEGVSHGARLFEKLAAHAEAARRSDSGRSPAARADRSAHCGLDPRHPTPTPYAHALARRPSTAAQVGSAGTWPPAGSPVPHADGSLRWEWGRRAVAGVAERS